MVADRANAAQALHDDGHVPVGPALDEAFETAELDDVQAHLADHIIVVRQQGHLAVTLDARDRFDDVALQLFTIFGSRQLGSHSVSHQS